MGRFVKHDNTGPRSKIALRRYFLDRYHGAGPINVLDCCQGDGLIWGRLGQEFKLDSYLGLDIKAKPGRLQIKSERFVAQPGWTHNVVDVDTYGSPWRHWRAMLPNITRPTTVFLTIGTVMIYGATDSITLEEMGLRFKAAKLPATFARKLAGFSVATGLAMSYNHRLRVIEAAESEGTISMRYIGLHLEPENGSETSRIRHEGMGSP